MAIRGLTDREASFPQIGVIHKGDVKGEKGPGRDLTWFRFESQDVAAKQSFRDHYGLEPVALHAFVPYNTTEKNFEAWKEEWAASSLRHRCDGEYVTIQLQASGKYKIPGVGERVLCPGNCKPVGRLKLIIPELKRLGYVTLQTTSIHDIMEITNNLRAIEETRGSLTGVPLIVRRVPREISTPSKDGMRKRRTVSLVHIEARPDWVQMQLAAMAEAALPPVSIPSEPLALPSWPGAVIEDDEDTAESESIPTVAGSSAVMTREQFKARWESSDDGGGITYDDIAECAIAWGIARTPRTMQIDKVRNLVLEAAGIKDEDDDLTPKALEDEIKRFCMTLFDRNKTAAKNFFDAEYADLSFEDRQEKFLQHKDRAWWIDAINQAMTEAVARGVSQDAIGQAVEDNGGWGFDDLDLSSLRKIRTSIVCTKGGTQ